MKTTRDSILEFQHHVGLVYNLHHDRKVECEKDVARVASLQLTIFNTASFSKEKVKKERFSKEEVEDIFIPVFPKLWVATHW